MNAKEEFLDHTQGMKIKCAKISTDPHWSGEGDYKFLKIGYTESDFHFFLNEIDVNYDNGYGGQELYGIIWYEDGTWSERGEYDGSEWWAYQETPEIDKELTQMTS